MDIAINAVLTIIGLVMLCYGGNWLVNGGAAIAKRFGISQLIIGMTVVAYGTSTPELAASLAAAQEHGQIILGNVIGSNVANIGMVIGVAAILVPLAVSKSMLRKEIPIMLGVSFLIVALSIDGEISQSDGVLLIVGLGVFTAYTFLGAKKTKDQNAAPSSNSKKLLFRSGFLIAIGIGLLYGGAILTVDNAVILAESFGISERIIGLTVIAIGTSLPELITSILAIRKGHSDIGVGNIIGSNIYNILMIMGVSSVIAGVVVVPQVFVDYGIMIAFSLSILIAIKTGFISRVVGIGLAAAYVVYLVTALVL